MKLAAARTFAIVSFVLLGTVLFVVRASSRGAPPSPGETLDRDPLLYEATSSPRPQYVATDSEVDCPDEEEMQKFLAAGHSADGLSGIELGRQLHIACGRDELVPHGVGFDVLQRYDGYARVFVHATGFGPKGGYERWVPRATIERAAKLH